MTAYPQRTPAQWLTYWQYRERDGTAGAQASIKMSNRIRAIARAKNIDPWRESEALFGVTFEVLSVGASRALADYFDSPEFETAIKGEVI